MHVWSVRGLPGIRRLERRATFIPQDRPSSAITWRKGKGVLGQVWVRDDWILADLEPLASASTEREFYEIPREHRFLFTWQEARATARYKAILAWPLHGGAENARRVIGCLSVDAQASGGATELGRAWDHDGEPQRSRRGVRGRPERRLGSSQGVGPSLRSEVRSRGGPTRWKRRLVRSS